MNDGRGKLLIIDIIFGFLFPTVITILFLAPLLFRSGFVFYGDEQWPIYFYPKNYINSILYSWASGGPTSSGSFIFTFLILGSVKLLGVYFANKLTVFLLVFLSGPVAYFSLIGIFRTYKVNSLILARFAAFVGEFFYVANWQNPALITPLYSWAFSYIITPALVYLLLRIFKDHKLSDIVFFALISTLGDPVPLWIITAIILGVTLLLSKLFRHDRKREMLKSLKDIGLLIVFTVLANAYFLVESLYGFLLGAGGQYAEYSSISTSIATAKGSSFLSFLDVFVYGQSSFYFFGSNPKNWTYLNFAVPIIIIVFTAWIIFQRSSLGRAKLTFIVKPKQFSLLFAASVILLVISSFLAKGFNAPFGNLYYIIIKLSPPGILGITRDVSPFLMISAIAYTLLFGIITLSSLQYISYYVKKNNKTTKHRMTTIKSKKGIVFSIVLVSLLVISSGAIIEETNSTLPLTYERFSPTYLPQNLSKAVNFINSQNVTGNVMWIPTGGNYPWKNNSVLTDFGANLVRNASNPDYIYNYLFKMKGTSLGSILALSNTDYLIYNANASFAFNYPVEINKTQILSLFGNQTDLKMVYDYGGIYIFKNLALPKPLYAGTPKLGNPYPSIFNISGLDEIGGSLYVNNSNPYIALYTAGVLKPTKIQKVNGSIPSSLISSHTFVKYKQTPTLYDYNSTDFHLLNYTIRNGFVTTEIHYKIPQFLRKYSGSGEFSPSFSLEAELYKTCNMNIIGSNDFSYQDLHIKQSISNNDTGNVTITVKYISGTSLYVNYYFGCYRLASPLYYIGSLGSENSLFTNPFSISSVSSQHLLDTFIPYNKYINSTIFAVAPQIESKNGTLKLQYSAIAYLPTSVFSFSNITATSIVSDFDIHVIPQLQESVGGLLYTLKNANQTISLSKGINETIYVNSPVKNEYKVKLRVFSGEIIYKGNLLGSGNYSFHTYLNDSATIRLQATMKSSISLKIFDKDENNTGVLSGVTELDPAHYKAYLAWNGLTIIVFPQEYSNLWVLNYNGNIYHSFPLYGGAANGFLLDNPNGTINIDYEMQNALNIGYLITGTFAMITFGALIIYVVKNEKKKK